MNNSTTATCQLIGGDGTFNVNGIESFGKEVNWATCGRSYVIVSIFGPQNSGKSTLLNHLFGTNFKEMDARKGRSATTKGIWLARSCDGMEQPLTIAMDVEGADSQEREDDTAFEKQSALFALAVSDIVLINMWYNDIGRRNAACNPLLETVFQVMTRLFKARRITLIFVIRDMTTMTPFEIIKPDIEKNIQKIWDSVSKGPTQEDIPLSQHFKIKVVALSHYEHETKKFKEKVDSLRQQIKHSIAPGGFVEDRDKVVPASSLPLSMQHIWKTIKENKDLNLPAVKAMVSNIRCQEIADEKYRKFTQNQDWLELKVASQSGLASKFGKKLNSIIVHCLCEYNSEVAYYDEEVRTKIKKKLEQDLLKLIEPAVKSTLQHLRKNSVEKFKEEFNKCVNDGKAFSAAFDKCKDTCMEHFAKGCADEFIEPLLADSDVKSRMMSKLRNDIDGYTANVRLSKLAELTSLFEKRLKESLMEQVNNILLDPTNYEILFWPTIGSILQHETNSARTELLSVLPQFDLDEQSKQEMLAKLTDYARSVIEAKAKELAENISSLMNARFKKLFQFEGEIPRKWTKKTNITSLAKEAHYACLKLLAALAAIQLDDEFEDLFKYLIVLLDTKGYESSDKVKHLASTSWNKIPLLKTVITPLQCSSLWKEFLKETDPIIQDAKGAVVHDTSKERQKGVEMALGVVNSVCSVVGGIFGVANFAHNLGAGANN